MLQMVRRLSIGSARIAGPAYSTAYPVPTATPYADQVEDQILGGDARRRSLPLKLTRIVFGLRSSSVWVASTCSTSVVPMPQPQAPTAAVGRGMAVAAHHRHAGQHDAELGRDDVDDALVADR